MKSLTKNHQSEQVIAQMVERCFPLCKMERCKELTEGYFNVAYVAGKVLIQIGCI